MRSCVVCTRSFSPTALLLTPMIILVALLISIQLPIASASPGHDIEFLLAQRVDLTPVKTLNRAQVASDINLLLHVLDRAYGGHGVLPENQYIDLKNELARIPESTGQLSSSNFCDLIATATEKVDDYHLTVSIGGSTCVRKWPKGNVGENSGDRPTWSLAEFTKNQTSIPILSIRKMTSALSSDWDGFEEALYTLVRRQEPFVLDLRGNPGGDVKKAYSLAQALFGLPNQSSLPLPEKTIYRRQNFEAFTLLANSIWLEIQDRENGGWPAPEYLRQKYNEMLNWRSKSNDWPEIHVEKIPKISLTPQAAFSAPIYALIDRRCGSSCELLLEALEQLPSLVTVGEPTTGVVKYGNLGALYLPNSRVVVRIPTQGAIYADNRRVEKMGYQPKVFVPYGTDALEFVIKKYFQ